MSRLADKLLREESRYEHAVHRIRALVRKTRHNIVELRDTLMAAQADLDAITQGMADEEEAVASAILDVVGRLGDMQTQLDAANAKLAAGDALVAADVQKLQAAKDGMEQALATIPGVTPVTP